MEKSNIISKGKLTCCQSYLFKRETLSFTARNVQQQYTKVFYSTGSEPRGRKCEKKKKQHFLQGIVNRTVLALMGVTV